MHNRKTVIILAGLVIVMISGYYLITYYIVQSSFDHDDVRNDLKFDKDIWQNGTIRQRGQMVNFLLDSIGIINKTKKEIRTITGDPDYESDVNDGAYKSKFYYTVDRGHAFSYEMIVSFDSTEHAKFILFDD